MIILFKTYFDSNLNLTYVNTQTVGINVEASQFILGDDAISSFDVVPKRKPRFERHFTIDKGGSLINIQVTYRSLLNRKPITVYMATLRNSARKFVIHNNKQFLNRDS